MIQALGIDTPEYFERVTSPVQTFKQKAEWVMANDPAFLEGRPGPVKMMESALRKHIIPALGDLPLHMVDETRVQEFIASLKTRVFERRAKDGHVIKTYKLSRSTIRNIVNVVKRVVGKRVWISWDLKLGRRPEKVEQRYFTEAQMAAIVEEAEGMWKVFFSVLAATGIRIGENCGLMVEDLDLVNQVITIRRSFSEIASTMLPPKSRAGYREIDVDQGLCRALADYLAGRTSGLVFPSRRGTPLRGGNVIKRVLNPILRKLGIPTGGKVNHAFRHGRVTVLRKNKTPGDLQTLWIGHSSLEMTDRYSHTDQELEYRKQHVVSFRIQ